MQGTVRELIFLISRARNAAILEEIMDAPQKHVSKQQVKSKISSRDPGNGYLRVKIGKVAVGHDGTSHTS